MPLPWDAVSGELANALGSPPDQFPNTPEGLSARAAWTQKLLNMGIISPQDAGMPLGALGSLVSGAATASGGSFGGIGHQLPPAPPRPGGAGGANAAGGAAGGAGGAIDPAQAASFLGGVPNWFGLPPLGNWFVPGGNAPLGGLPGRGSVPAGMGAPGQPGLPGTNIFGLPPLSALFGGGYGPFDPNDPNVQAWLGGAGGYNPYNPLTPPGGGAFTPPGAAGPGVPGGALTPPAGVGGFPGQPGSGGFPSQPGIGPGGGAAGFGLPYLPPSGYGGYGPTGGGASGAPGGAPGGGSITQPGGVGTPGVPGGVNTGGIPVPGGVAGGVPSAPQAGGATSPLQAPTVAGGAGIAGLDPTALINQYQSAYQAALQGNQDRYNQIMQGYHGLIDTTNAGQADLLHNTQNTYNTVMGTIQGLGQSQRQDINDAYAREQAHATQSLVGRGLGNTSVVDSVSRGITSDQQRSMIALNDALSREQAQYQTQLLGNVNATQQAGLDRNLQMGQGLLSFQNSVNQPYPDAGFYSSLIGSAGAAQQQQAGLASQQQMQQNYFNFLNQLVRQGQQGQQAPVQGAGAGYYQPAPQQPYGAQPYGTQPYGTQQGYLPPGVIR